MDNKDFDKGTPEQGSPNYNSQDLEIQNDLGNTSSYRNNDRNDADDIGVNAASEDEDAEYEDAEDEDAEGEDSEYEDAEDEDSEYEDAEYEDAENEYPEDEGYNNSGRYLSTGIPPLRTESAPSPNSTRSRFGQKQGVFQGRTDFNGFSMRWFYFFVNGFLPISITISLIQLTNFLMAGAKSYNGNIMLFFTNMQSGLYYTVNLIAIIATIILSVLLFIELRKFSKRGYKIFWYYIGTVAFFRLIFVVLAFQFTAADGMGELRTTLMMLGYYALNSLYFYKRKSLFN